MPRNNEVFRLRSAYIEGLHDEGIAISWPGIEPVPPNDCIDLNLLESAGEQPYQAVFGIECYPTVFDKAACIFFQIAGGHIFTNGNKRTAVLAIDQFLHANAHYLFLSNAHMQRMAENTASYRERKESHKDVMATISEAVRTNSFPFSAARKSRPKLYRRLHYIKKIIREAPLNAATARPRQVLLRGY